VSQGLAIGADLDFVFLAVALHDRFVGDQFVVLGEGFDFKNFAGAGFRVEACLHSGGQGIHSHLLFDLEDAPVGIDEDVFAVTVDG